MTASPASAPMQSASLLKQIDDIRGLDRIGWWPLAPGWWVLIGVIALGLVSWIFLSMRRRAYERSWRADADRALDRLDERVRDGATQQLAADFSALLRRIAMQRYGRAACAGLEGMAWLTWLRDHDPRGFDWISAGELLTEAPYAPPSTPLPSGSLHEAIAAAKTWVAKGAG